ncbi:hypothetical protein KSS87_012631 [Heliosperma pusillum]|nr:hypothetical protein KSS87_012631 [Heliosperma pusillum]
MAKLLAIAILSPLIVFSLVPSSASFSVFNNAGLSLHNSNNDDFDYFVLALQWPPTNCRNTNTLHCCQSNACCSRFAERKNLRREELLGRTWEEKDRKLGKKIENWDGLWCNYNDGSWPSCCGDNNFNEKEISTLRKALDEYWPTLFCGSTSTCDGHKGSFYAHEKVLSEAGYTPSNSEKYPLAGVITAIENAFHAPPLIVCSGGAIQEIRLCFYKDFKPRDCAVTSGIVNKVDSSASSCPKYVSLPAYVSSGLRSGETLIELQPNVEAQ